MIVASNNGHCGCVAAGDDCTATWAYSWQFRNPVTPSPTPSPTLAPTSWYLWSESKICANQRWYPNAYAYAGGVGGTSPGGGLTKEQALESLPYCVNALAQDSTCSMEWMIVASNNGHCGCVEAGDDCSATRDHTWQFRNSDPPTSSPTPAPPMCTYDIDISRSDHGNGVWNTVTVESFDGDSFSFSGCSTEGVGQMCVIDYGVAAGVRTLVNSKGAIKGYGVCCNAVTNAVVSTRKNCLAPTPAPTPSPTPAPTPS